MNVLLALLAAGALAPATYASAVALALALARARHDQVSDGPAPPPLALVAEVRRKWTVRGWALASVPPQPADADDEVPVLCVHGFVGRSGHFHGLQRYLHPRGIPTESVDLGWRFLGIPSYTPPLVEALSQRPRWRVVAHSMGGIVLRQALVERPDLAERISHVVTLGSPHTGTDAIILPGLRLPNGQSTDIEHLAPDSPFLASLPGLDALLPHAIRVAIAAEWDVTVFPVRRSLPPGMDHVVLDGFGHMGLLTDEASHRAVEQALRRTEQGAV